MAVYRIILLLIKDTSREAIVRHESAEALGAIGAADVLPVLKKFCQDPVPEVGSDFQNTFLFRSTYVDIFNLFYNLSFFELLLNCNWERKKKKKGAKGERRIKPDTNSMTD